MITILLIFSIKVNFLQFKEEKYQEYALNKYLIQKDFLIYIYNLRYYDVNTLKGMGNISAWNPHNKKDAP